MRAITRIGLGPLLAATALACVFAAPPARAQLPICNLPSNVAAQYLASIATLGRVDFPEPPSQELCDKIASDEEKGCLKAVKNAEKCYDVMGAVIDTMANADCATLGDETSQKACEDDVKASSKEFDQTMKDDAAAGNEACKESTPAVVALCLGEDT